MMASASTFLLASFLHDNCTVILFPWLLKVNVRVMVNLT